jgi:MoaA/NifB/PqqE/SkfB family radical SAM enzyme
MKHWSILYRGSLSSCNYACEYCPFAKTKNTRRELQSDAIALERFVHWVLDRKESIGILFTPWGEALIRKYYQKAMTLLSHSAQVRKVAIQTNLSCDTKWMEEVNTQTFALWTTFHPDEVNLSKFLQKCASLDRLNIRYSVGVVGLKKNFEYITALRQYLAPHIYLWVNAYKREKNYYLDAEIEFLNSIDPLFTFNNQYHSSQNLACKTGNTVFSVDEHGDVRRCHFIEEKIGNIYSPDFEQVLLPRLCTAQHCGCYIGYVHLDKLQLYEVYQSGVLERIPDSIKNSTIESLSF